MSYNFNGEQKIISITGTNFSIEVGDVYSRWKEWSLLNQQFEQAFSVVGGDPLPGGRSLGFTFFLENGWRIRPREADHTLDVVGNLFTRDGSSPFIQTLGNFNVLVRQSVSNLVDVVYSSGGGGTAVNVNDIAQAVRAALSTELSRIDTNISSRASQASVSDIISEIDQLVLNSASITADITAMKPDIAEIVVDITTLLSVTEMCRKMHMNRSRIDPQDKTLTIYEDDGVTPMRVYSLRNRNNAHSVTEVFEKIPL